MRIRRWRNEKNAITVRKITVTAIVIAVKPRVADSMSPVIRSPKRYASPKKPPITTVAQMESASRNQRYFTFRIPAVR